ncbi:cystathionine gamma-synthase [Vespertiliibacter pulmonis]|uniref:Cytochrome c-type biogenesis protein n=1 Tax=Vespertiliibacter pulmonis TaxID=1443036 RepID=A0A3N4VS78_9PAST|nr:cytochrome c-type biogenesis protein [Vespertiliibacter pulmonis]QLB20643.1 cystathionine gamma-synthase [Vespertiliibacter pulmonis]RPE82779.1 cytochrome c-type biogenesis protein CcmH [Vespertiliibacter pulmonis]
MKKWLLLLLLPTLSIATIEPQQFDSPQQEADYRALIQELRCPQCQNNNIADSNATIAEDMRYKSLELLKQGKNKEEVIHYMVERYGNFVTYDPPITPATIFLWLMPLLLISIGILIMASRRKLATQAKNSSPKTINNLDHTRLQQILNEQGNKDK